MKTIFKIAAIAAITALAVISCSPPELPEARNEYWDQYNDQFDATKYTGRGGAGLPISFDSGLTAYDDNYTGVKEDNTVTISFPDTADVLKKGTLTTSDLNFISFYTFNATAALAAEAAATSAAPNTAATSLNELQGWSFDRRSGNTVVVKLPAIYKTSSKIVIKIDSSKYTYSNGLKIDKDNNGVAGEKGYDDIYETRNVSGITNTVNPITPVNKPWTVNLVSLTFSPGITDTTTAADYQLATTTFTPGISTVTAADYESILKALAGGFKVEKFSGGNWSSASAGSIDDTSTPSRIIAKSLSATHNTAYRVVFEKGSISLETAKEFYGLKQRISVMYGGNTIAENAKIKKTKLESSAGVYINTTKRDFKDFNSGIDHPPVYDWIYNTDRPKAGYWRNGFIQDPNFNKNDDYDPGYNADPSNPSDDDYKAHQFLQPGDPGYETRASDPNPVYVTDDFTNGSWVEGDEYGNWYQELNPPRGQPSTTKNITGWKWNVNALTAISNFEATDWDTKRGQMIYDWWYERYVEVTNHSHDGFGGNIVLKIKLNYPIVTTGSPSVTNYFKEIDATAFKNNFKIYSYSPVDSGNWYNDGQGNSIWVPYWVDPGLKDAKDVVEIGIDKVEFKLEGLVSTTASPISGKNVIYITLDPNYRQNDKIKYFYIGDGIGYADGVTTFSSSNIWDDKGFKGYPVSGVPVDGVSLKNDIF